MMTNKKRVTVVVAMMIAVVLLAALPISQGFVGDTIIIQQSSSTTKTTTTTTASRRRTSSSSSSSILQLVDGGRSDWIHKKRTRGSNTNPFRSSSSSSSRRYPHNNIATTTTTTTTTTQLEASLLSLSSLGCCCCCCNNHNLNYSYYLTRIVFLRALSFVYFIAFLIAHKQNKPLIGDNGITPARYELCQARNRGRQKRQRRQLWLEQTFDDKDGTTLGQQRLRRQRQQQQQQQQQQHLLEKILQQPTTWMLRFFLKVRKSSFYQTIREVLWDRSDRMNRPMITILWLAELIQSKKNKNYEQINGWLDGIALVGMVTSTIVFFLGSANLPILLTLWICQRSLSCIGGPWYGYGWETQLAELGFHALFLVPLLSLKPITTIPVPTIVIWTIRWHLFRIMIGAGLIKFRSGDNKWKLKNLTTMNYFYETQPVPSILTRTMHFMPTTWHKFEVLCNHMVECVAPFFLILPLLPRKLLRFAGLLQMQFQGILICTGNLSFLNWLTMVPAIFCLDDGFLSRFFSPSRVMEVSSLVAASSSSSSSFITRTTTSISRNLVSIAFGGLVAWLSVPVVKNLLSKKQKMNASFDPLRLINTYGAFGVVDEERNEWIIESAPEIDGPWKEYEFKVKPGSVDRPPRWITPYHYRLDWQMWIASTCRSLDRSPWMYRFLIKLLERDPGVQKLLAKDPWENNQTKGQPKYIRVLCYKYKFHRDDKSKGRGEEPYWDREFSKRLYPLQGAATIESLREEISEPS